MRYFNTAGPGDPRRHYLLHPEPRLPDARTLIEMDRFLVVHAPRRTGKTTTLGSLARRLNAEGAVAAVCVSGEDASITGDDFGTAELILLDGLRQAAGYSGLSAAALPPDQWPDPAPGSRLGTGNFPTVDDTFDDDVSYVRDLGLDTGTLVIFDRRPEAPPWSERTTLTPTGRKVTLLRA